MKEGGCAKDVKLISHYWKFWAHFVGGRKIKNLLRSELCLGRKDDRLSGGIGDNSFIVFWKMDFNIKVHCAKFCGFP